MGGSGKLEKVSVWMFKLVYTMVEPHPLEEGWARWARWRRVWAFFPCGQTQNWDNSECCFVFCVGKGTAACFLSGYLGIYIIKLSIIVVVRSSLSLVASSFVCVFCSLSSTEMLFQKRVLPPLSSSSSSPLFDNIQKLSHFLFLPKFPNVFAPLPYIRQNDLCRS